MPGNAIAEAFVEIRADASKLVADTRGEVTSALQGVGTTATAAGTEASAAFDSAATDIGGLGTAATDASTEAAAAFAGASAAVGDVGSDAETAGGDVESAFETAGSGVEEAAGKIGGFSGALSVLKGSADTAGAGFDEMTKKVNSGMVAGALAIGAFALASVNKFQETALAAGKFADTTGLGVEAASRWIAVGDDIGVGASTMQGAFTKFNLAVANGKPTLDRYGIDIVKAKDGTTDASASFINAATTIGQIQDPTKRAQAAQEVFGRSYGEIAELMTKDADELTAALAGVSKSQVISDKELAQARAYRDQLDALTDMVGDFMIQIGEKLVPILVDLGKKIEGAGKALSEINNVTEKLTGNGLDHWFGKVVGAALPTTGLFDGLNRAMDGNASASERVFGGFETLVGGIPGVGQGLKELGNVLWPKVTAVVDTSAGSLASYLEAQDEAKKATEEMVPVLTLAELRQRDHNEAVVAAYEAQYKQAEASKTAAAALDASQAAAARARDEQNRLADAAFRVEQKARDQMAAWDELTGKLDTDQAFNNLATKFDALTGKVGETTAKAGEWAAAIDQVKLDMQNNVISQEEGAGRIALINAAQEQGMRDIAGEIINTKKEVLAYGEQIGGLPIEKATKFLALIDQGKLDQVEAELAIMTRNREVQVSIVKKGGIGFTVRNTTGGFDVFADGTIATQPTLGWFGEAGTEALIPVTRPGRAMELMDKSGLGAMWDRMTNPEIDHSTTARVTSPAPSSLDPEAWGAAAARAFASTLQQERRAA